MKINYYFQSNIGRFRENNEDNFYIDGKIRNIEENTLEQEGIIESSSPIFAVFDGMGGESCGEQASFISAKTLQGVVEQSNAVNMADFLQKANDLVCDYTKSNNLKRCGTTAVLIQINNGKAVSSNIGDSRAYLFHGGKLRQLSYDHTEFQQMKDMAIENELNIPEGRKNVLTQFLGIFPDEMQPEPFFSEKIKVAAGDIFLLCSDGLYGKLSLETIESFFKDKMSLAELGRKLIDSAIANKEKDNITVLLAEATETDKNEINSFFTEIMNKWKKIFRNN